MRNAAFSKNKYKKSKFVRSTVCLCREAKLFLYPSWVFRRGKGKKQLINVCIAYQMREPEEEHLKVVTENLGLYSICNKEKPKPKPCIWRGMTEQKIAVLGFQG